MYRNLRDGLRADVGRAIAMATGGVVVFAPIEYGLTLWTYSGSTSLVSKLDLIALALTLSVFLWLVVVVGLAALLAGVRIVRARIDPAAGRATGLFGYRALDDGIRPGVPRAWAALSTTLVYAVVIQRLAAWATVRFKEPQLTAAAVAGLAIGAALICIPFHRASTIAAHVAARALTMFGPFNPLGRWRACGLTLAALVIAVIVMSSAFMPGLRSVIPERMVASGLMILIGFGFGARHFQSARRRPRTKKQARLFAGAALVVIWTTLIWWGADLEAKGTAVSASPAFDKLVELVRFANDVDGDGFGSLLGEIDCGPFNSSIHTGAPDPPNDGIDQNCDGKDSTYADFVMPSGPVVPIPTEFRRSDWNILLLTIDATRYDHTTFGGYKRDTTPHLADLVAKSTSFVYANAPAPGTMASIPAILTSKFFHSGIAIDDDAPRPHGYPPIVLPENVLIGEVMKRGGYYTGAIGSHEWWTDWGIDQGFDEFDNSIGRVVDPYRVVADQVTDHALAFITRNHGKKWFLWAHYIDPHGRYVAHPDVVDYGTADMDLYDGEIKWTDQEIGRLLRELERLPEYQNTIVIVTSDHGESMGEHGVPTGTHGTALYRELTHVPLIFFIPGVKPKLMHGAVSPLDIFPTAAALGNIDISKMQIEGRSLVAQIFYNREDRDRVVFSETNAPNKRRAAISEHYRLLFYLSNNIYELFEHENDPEELKNLAPKEPPALAQMKKQLGDWMNRVMWNRDPLFNQSFRFYSDVILKEAPTPTVVATDQAILDGGGGKIEILGIGAEPTKPIMAGLRPEIFVYFHVIEPVTISYKLQLVAWPTATGAPLTDAVPVSALRSSFRVTAEGAYPTTQWQKGEYIRERFPLTLPADWKGEAMTIGISVAPVANNTPKIKATGPTPSNDAFLFVLGQLTVHR